MKREPVVTAAAVAAVLTTVATLLGLNVSSDTVQAVSVAVAALAPLVLGFLARRKVTPVGKHEKP